MEDRELPSARLRGRGRDANGAARGGLSWQQRQSRADSPASDSTSWQQRVLTQQRDYAPAHDSQGRAVAAVNVIEAGSLAHELGTGPRYRSAPRQAPHASPAGPHTSDSAGQQHNTLRPQAPYGSHAEPRASERAGQQLAARPQPRGGHWQAPDCSLSREELRAVPARRRPPRQALDRVDPGGGPQQTQYAPFEAGASWQAPDRDARLGRVGQARAAARQALEGNLHPAPRDGRRQPSEGDGRPRLWCDYAPDPPGRALEEARPAGHGARAEQAPWRTAPRYDASYGHANGYPNELGYAGGNPAHTEQQPAARAARRQRNRHAP